MSKRPERRAAIRLSRVDRERRDNLQQRARSGSGECMTERVDANSDNEAEHSAFDQGKVGVQSKATVKGKHTQRLRSRKKQPSLSPEDRRLLEDVPPHWTGGNQ